MSNPFPVPVPATVFSGACTIEVVSSNGGATLVILRGEVDLASADELHHTITRVGTITDTDVIVDCSELEFIDSTGLGALLHAQTVLAKGGHTLRLEGAQPFLARVLKVLALEDRLLGEPGAD
jgi:anti-sigma B factor antagonist